LHCQAEIGGSHRADDSAVAFVATGALFVSFVRRRAARWLWVPAAAWFFCNYRLATIPMGGLETSLSGLAVVAAAWLVIEWTDDLTPARAAVLGAALGVAFLSRMDALLFAAVVLGWLVFRAVQVRSWWGFRLAVLAGAARSVFSFRARVQLAHCARVAPRAVKPAGMESVAVAPADGRPRTTGAGVSNHNRRAGQRSANVLVSGPS
jgi:hypothetical protein